MFIARLLSEMSENEDGELQDGIANVLTIDLPGATKLQPWSVDDVMQTLKRVLAMDDKQFSKTEDAFKAIWTNQEPCYVYSVK